MNKCIEFYTRDEREHGNSTIAFSWFKLFKITYKSYYEVCIITDNIECMSAIQRRKGATTLFAKIEILAPYYIFQYGLFNCAIKNLKKQTDFLKFIIKRTQLSTYVLKKRLKGVCAPYFSAL